MSNVLDTSRFATQLAADGYGEIEAKTLAPHHRTNEHDHPFAVRGLVLEGAFTITVDGEPRVYRPGEEFALEANRLHFETVGAEGVRLVAGHRR